MPCVVILTALRVEYLAVRSHLANLQEELHSQGTIYERGIFEANEQTWEVGIVEVGAGNAGAAIEAERAIAYFRPDVLFFVGIASGIKDVNIGDVVAATDVYAYELGEAEAQQFLTCPKAGKSAYALVNRARVEARKEEWLQRLADANTPTSQPRVFVAPIAAGEKVIASRQSDVFQFLTASYNGALAVEMEGFGFLSAAFAYPNIKAMVIRGISDLISDSDDLNQELEEIRKNRAAHHASAFAFEMLSKKLDPSIENPNSQSNRSIYAGENITNQDIYVPLSVKEINFDGSLNPDEYCINDWVENIINNSQVKRKIIFIEGDPGLGKSIFCSMFADRMERKDSQWRSILIKLDDPSIINHDRFSIDELLESKEKSLQDYYEWQLNPSCRLLIIFDGYDEILSHKDGSKILYKLFRAILNFNNIETTKDKNKQFLITGRPFQNIKIRELLSDNFSNCLQAEIQRMNRSQQSDLLDKLRKYYPEPVDFFNNYIENPSSADRELITLMKEPLLLYLLVSTFQQDDKTVIPAKKIDIFRQAVNKFIKPQQNVDTQVYLDLIYEAGLCIIQAGKNNVSTDVMRKSLNHRLSNYTCKQKYRCSDIEIAKRPDLFEFIDIREDPQHQSCRIIHDFLPEYLMANRLMQSLIEWTSQTIEDRSIQNIHQDIYQLLGCGGLNSQIIDYLLELLKSKFGDNYNNWRELVVRLKTFYSYWTENNYIDCRVGKQTNNALLDKINKFLQEKFEVVIQKTNTDIIRQAALIKKETQDLSLRIREIDVYAGLNIMVLLFRIDRCLSTQFSEEQYLDIKFYPCGNPDSIKEFDRSKLLPIISYSESIKTPIKITVDDKEDSLHKYISYKPSAFEDIISPVLSHSDLRNINLNYTSIRDAILTSADLSNASLIGTNLSRAILKGAKLVDTKLRRADLREADLREDELGNKTDLTGAILDSADLNGAKLVGAKMASAKLPRAYLPYADLSYANLNRSVLTRSILDRAKLYHANLEGADLTYASFRRTDLRKADLKGAILYGASFVDAIVTGADFTNVRWDNTINWFGAKGLHTIQFDTELNRYLNWIGAIQLSQAIDAFIINHRNGQCNDYCYQELVIKYGQVIGINLETDSIIDDQKCSQISNKLKAQLRNKFCWICTLYDFADRPEVIKAGEDAHNYNKDVADYLDTLGMNFMMRGDLDRAKHRFQFLLHMEEFKNWSSISKQRRINWLNCLEQNKNSFEENPEWLEELRQDEYPQ